MELVIALAFVAYSSWRMAAFVSTDRLEKTVLSVVIASLFIAYSMLGLGLIGFLSPASLVVCALAAGIATFIWHGRVRQSAQGRATREPSESSLGHMEAAVATDSHYRLLYTTDPVGRVLGIGSCVLIGLVWTLTVWVGVNRPPYSYDSMAYHLRGVLSWLQTGHVGMETGSIWSNAYPMNVELLSGWAVGLSRWVRLGFVPNAFILGAAVVAAYGVARRFQLSRNAGRVVAAVVFLSPPFFLQMSTEYVDAVTAAFLVMALYLILSDKPGVRLLGVAAAAFSMGSKATAIAPAACIMLVYLWMTYRQSKYHTIGMVKRLTSRSMLVAFVAVLLTGGIIGGFWYWRNLMAYGNPMYPFHQAFFQGIDLDNAIMLLNTPPELRDLNPLERIWHAWSGLRPFYTYDTPYGGLGLVVTFIGIPSILIGVWLLWRYRTVSQKLQRKYSRDTALCVLSVFALACFWITPANWWGRYDLNVLLLPALFIGYCMDWMKRFHKTKAHTWLSLGLLVLLVVQTAFAVGIGEWRRIVEPNFDAHGYARDKLFEGDPYVIGEELSGVRIGYQGVPFADALRGERLQNRIDYVDAYDDATLAWYLGKRPLRYIAVIRDAPLAGVLSKAPYAKLVAAGKLIAVYKLTGEPRFTAHPLSSLSRLSEEDVFKEYHPGAGYDQNKAFLAALAVREETDPGQKALRLKAYEMLLQSGQIELAGQQRAILERYYPGIFLVNGVSTSPM